MKDLPAGKWTTIEIGPYKGNTLEGAEEHLKYLESIDWGRLAEDAKNSIKDKIPYRPMVEVIIMCRVEYPHGVLFVDQSRVSVPVPRRLSNIRTTEYVERAGEYAKECILQLKKEIMELRR